MNSPWFDHARSLSIDDAYRNDYKNQFHQMPFKDYASNSFHQIFHATTQDASECH